MKLTTGNPYWLMKNGYLYSYPSLQQDLKTEVVILGGGITGALAAYRLVKAGFEVTVVDKRNIGMGSTSASTALLQYEIDTPLYELAGKVGERRAIESYRSCYRSIDELEAMLKEENFEVCFEKRSSLQYASCRQDGKRLEKEAVTRKAAGIPVEVWEEKEIEKQFGFKAPLALYSCQAAQLDPYLLTHCIFHRGYENLQVYDRTEVRDIQPDTSRIVLYANTGKKIEAAYLIVAAGYESQKYISHKIVDLHTTYAVISKPLQQEIFWYENALIWETKVPYLYLRTTPDQRIIVGGRDDRMNRGRRREKNLPKKAAALAEDFRRQFPGLFFHIDFAWAGTFGSTRDSLPYIGSIRHMPRTFFALGFGGNGVTFSVIAAEVLAALLQGKPHPLALTFGFDREENE